MKGTFAILGFLLLFGSTPAWRGGAAAADAASDAGTEATATAAPDSAEAQRQIDAGNAQFIRGWMTGDADAFADCFASDGALFRGGGAVVPGRDAIRDRMRGAFRRYRMSAGSIRTTGLWFVDGRAYETGKWVFTIGKVDSLAAAEPDSGYYLEIWRPEGGRWRMWRDIGIPQE